MSKLLWIAVFLTVISVGLSEQCSYNYSKDNHTCVLMNATITVDVLYVNEDNKTDYVRIPINCSSLKIQPDSSCNKTNIIMVHSWDDYDITFEFYGNRNKGHQQWSIVKISVDIYVENGPHFSDPKGTGSIVGYKNSSLFGDGFDYQRSYMCNAANNMSLTMDSKDNNNATYFTMYLTIQDFRVQAFDNPSQFGNAQRCSKDIKGSKIVPIAVGAALAGLVIIVLIAYIIGRLRSRRQSSYEALS